jgi:hypothetical protein
MSAEKNMEEYLDDQAVLRMVRLLRDPKTKIIKPQSFVHDMVMGSNRVECALRRLHKKGELKFTGCTVYVGNDNAK